MYSGVKVPLYSAAGKVFIFFVDQCLYTKHEAGPFCLFPVLVLNAHTRMERGVTCPTGG